MDQPAHEIPTFQLTRQFRSQFEFQCWHSLLSRAIKILAIEKCRFRPHTTIISRQQ